MDATDYSQAWQAYAAASAVAVLVLWSMTLGGRWLYIKWVFRLLCVALVATPIYHADAASQFVPAVLPATLGWLLGGESEAMPAWRMLGISSLIAVVLAFPMSKLERRLRQLLAPKAAPEAVSASAHTADPAGD